MLRACLKRSDGTLIEPATVASEKGVEIRTYTMVEPGSLLRLANRGNGQEATNEVVSLTVKQQGGGTTLECKPQTIPLDLEGTFDLALPPVKRFQAEIQTGNVQLRLHIGGTRDEAPVNNLKFASDSEPLEATPFGSLEKLAFQRRRLQAGARVLNAAQGAG